MSVICGRLAVCERTDKLFQHVYRYVNVFVALVHDCGYTLHSHASSVLKSWLTQHQSETVLLCLRCMRSCDGLWRMTRWLLHWFATSCVAQVFLSVVFRQRAVRVLNLEFKNKRTPLFFSHKNAPAGSSSRLLGTILMDLRELLIRWIVKNTALSWPVALV